MSEFIVYEVYGRDIETFTVIENTVKNTFDQFYGANVFEILNAVRVVAPNTTMGHRVPYSKYKDA